MSMAFAVTEDDVEIVLNENGKSAGSDEHMIEIMDTLDHQRIEKAALYFDDMDEQTTSAHEEMELQLKEHGFI